MDLSVQHYHEEYDLIPQQLEGLLKQTHNTHVPVSQTLLPSTDGEKRVAALEIMLCTPAVRSLIRENKTHQIASIIEVNHNEKMQTKRQPVEQLITDRDALELIDEH